MGTDRAKIRWNGWGWGAHKDEFGAREALWTWLANELGMPALLATPPRPLEEVALAASALTDEDRQGLSAIVGADRVREDAYERACHALGRSTRDLLRLRAGDLAAAPDAVIYPRGTEEVLAVLKLASERAIAVIPYGGGTGDLCSARGSFKAAIVLDLSAMDRLIGVDQVAGTATLEAGICGPALEKALQAKGFTLGHYPQSFEFSTLGGWIVSRGIGQSANRYGHAEDWLVGVKLATPRGLLTEGDFPASPRLKDFVLGSEGVFGIVTEADVRIRALPAASCYRGYLFRDFASSTAAVRAAQKEEIATAMLRLSDAAETRFWRAFEDIGKPRTLARRLADFRLKVHSFDDKACVLIAGFEGAAIDAARARKHFDAIARRHDALVLGKSVGERWRASRFRLPYLRDSMLDRGAGVDMVAAEASWSKLGALYAATRAAIEAAIRATAPREGARGVVMGHIGPSYADGASLTFVYIFPRALGDDIAQERKIKNAATEAILANGGTQKNSELGVEVLGAIKRTLDPNGVLNPGKMVAE